MFCPQPSDTPAHQQQRQHQFVFQQTEDGCSGIFITEMPEVGISFTSVTLSFIQFHQKDKVHLTKF